MCRHPPRDETVCPCPAPLPRPLGQPSPSQGLVPSRHVFQKLAQLTGPSTRLPRGRGDERAPLQTSGPIPQPGLRTEPLHTPENRDAPLVPGLCSPLATGHLLTCSSPGVVPPPLLCESWNWALVGEGLPRGPPLVHPPSIYCPQEQGPPIISRLLRVHRAKQVSLLLLSAFT